MMSIRWSRWCIGGILAGLLLVAYVTVWRPTRAYVTAYGTSFLFRKIDTERSRSFDCLVLDNGLSLQVRTSSSKQAPPSYRAPAGILFLLPALLLALCTPFKPYVLVFWSIHVAFGFLLTGTFALGIAWTDAGFTLYHFLDKYVIRALSLATPVVAFYLEKAKLHQ